VTVAWQEAAALAAGATVMVLAGAALAACSVRRTLDQQAMDEIKAACGLTGSRMVRSGARSIIDVHDDDNTDRKFACIQREVEQRNLAATINVGSLGVEPPTPEEQECFQRELETNGATTLNALAAIDEMCTDRGTRR